MKELNKQAAESVNELMGSELSTRLQADYFQKIRHLFNWLYFLQIRVDQFTLSYLVHYLLNQLQPGTAFLYPYTFRFSHVFRGYRKETPGYNGLKVCEREREREREREALQCNSHPLKILVRKTLRTEVLTEPK